MPVILDSYIFLNFFYGHYSIIMGITIIFLFFHKFVKNRTMRCKKQRETIAYFILQARILKFGTKLAHKTHIKQDLVHERELLVF